MMKRVDDDTLVAVLFVFLAVLYVVIVYLIGVNIGGDASVNEEEEVVLPLHLLCKAYDNPPGDCLERMERACEENGGTLKHDERFNYGVYCEITVTIEVK